MYPVQPSSGGIKRAVVGEGMRGIFGWDLPPGVSVNDIPGNEPEKRKRIKVNTERKYCLRKDTTNRCDDCDVKCDRRLK